MSEPTREITVSLGLIADPIPEQLAGMAWKSDLENFEYARIAIGTLRCLRYIPDSVAAKARKKLANRIYETVRAYMLKQKVEANVAFTPLT